MKPTEVIELALDADVALRVFDGRLQVLCVGPVPDRVSHHIRQNEAALVRLMTTREDDEADDSSSEAIEAESGRVRELA